MTAGDAYVSHDADANRWSVGNSTIGFTVGFDPTGVFRVIELREPRSEPLAMAAAPDAFVTLAGRQMPLGASASGFTLEKFDAVEVVNGVRLDLTFTLREPRLRVTRSYACYRRAPVIETWMTFETLGNSVTLEGLNVWQVTVPNAPLRTITGLLGDDATNQNPNQVRQFTIERRELPPNGRLTLDTVNRSSDETIPWIVAEGSSGTFFGGLIWSGSWTLSAERAGDSIRMTLGLPDVFTTVGSGQRLEAPHGFFGLTRRAGATLSLAMQGFITRGLRGGRPFDTPVLYNTWFAYATNVNETSMIDAIDAAARLQMDLFVLDAGWYQGSGRRGAGDFMSGLGNWRVDPAKFPKGLRPLAEYARSAGLRFGIWVEPERVALDNIGRPGLADERWLAQNDGKYGSSIAAQLCLSDPRVRQWILQRLTQLIDEVQPDYLKWDNNFWINCTRSGHGHGTRDGNFAHVLGLYAILAELRSRYPDLMIENVSGGGNRLDFGMLRYTDTAWMDDRTAPASVVRHNLEGLAEVFPPAYLLSLAVSGPGEPMHADGPDLLLYVRSRMFGVLGFTFRAEEMGEADESVIVQQIAWYRTIAATLQRAGGVLLSDQTKRGEPAWDAFEAVTATGEAVVFAFQNDAGADRITLRPQGLRFFTDYDVVSLDAGVVLSATGWTLMTDGVEILASPVSASHVLILRPRARPPGVTILPP